ncbi:MAG: patatin-like phospholipase family protein [Gemmatimonadota bacterium]|nr:MAG: patatin-like phospholipase family protein [Gemmatimonadota bacterium]
METAAERRKSRFADLALVLSGGGARASYQVGVLAAITERVPELEAPILTGVSAGAINATSLASSPGSFSSAVGTLRREWKGLTADNVYCVRPTSIVRSSFRWLLRVLLRRRSGPGVLRGLMDMTPLRQFLSETLVLDGIARNVAAGRLDAVALSATSYTTGRTITFVQGHENVPVWERALRAAVRTELRLDHVLASAAIPIVFAAVKLEDGFYGDGSVRQTAPLAPAIHLGARRLIAISMRMPRGPVAPSVPIGDYPAAAEVVSLLFNAVFLDSIDADAERLERVNQLVAALPAGQASPGGLRKVDLLLLRPSRDLGALAKGHETKLPSLVRFAVQGMGGRRARGSDLVSYLMFEPSYTETLMDLGYSDASAQWPRIEEFVAACEC